MKTWITADWHLGENRFELMGRPFQTVTDHLEALKTEHNKLVAPDDELIFVGDVCYQKAEPAWLLSWLSEVEKFNGKKILVRGNHDKVFTNEQLKPYFDKIYDEGEGFYRNFGGIECYVTHYPTQGRDDAFNLVGHIHAAWKYQLNSLNIGVDVHHFRPVDTATIPFHFNAVSKFYDEDVWAAYHHINKMYHGVRGKKGTYFTPAL